MELLYVSSLLHASGPGHRNYNFGIRRCNLKFGRATRRCNFELQLVIQIFYCGIEARLINQDMRGIVIRIITFTCFGTWTSELQLRNSALQFEVWEGNATLQFRIATCDSDFSLRNRSSGHKPRHAWNCYTFHHFYMVRDLAIAITTLEFGVAN